MALKVLCPLTEILHEVVVSTVVEKGFDCPCPVPYVFVEWVFHLPLSSFFSNVTVTLPPVTLQVTVPAVIARSVISNELCSAICTSLDVEMSFFNRASKPNDIGCMRRKYASSLGHVGLERFGNAKLASS